MTTNFRVKTQSAAYSEGARDAYRLLVTMLEEGGINNLLDGIDCNADSDTRARMSAYYTAHNADALEKMAR